MKLQRETPPVYRCRQAGSERQPVVKRAIFLDRDGTINHDYGYTHKIADWHWLPGALAGLKIFAQNGWALVVVSNQSGIGRGYYGLDDLKKLEQWLDQQLLAEGIRIAAWKYCPHKPDDHCQCRKPSPYLLRQTARGLDIDLKTSWMLGDKISDIQAGMAAGCKTGLIANPLLPNEKEKAKKLYPGLPVWDNLKEAATLIGK